MPGWSRTRRPSAYSVELAAPANRRLPLLSVTPVAIARFGCSRAGAPVTVTLSPGTSALFAQPRRVSVTGLGNSNSHVTDAPASFFASTLIHACGLVHSREFTVPFTVTDFSRSYAAPE